jgi:hypothetical protein
MSAVAYICTLYTQNKIALISIIVDDCSAYKRQMNIEGEISPYISQGEYAHSNRLSAT